MEAPLGCVSKYRVVAGAKNILLIGLDDSQYMQYVHLRGCDELREVLSLLTSPFPLWGFIAQKVHICLVKVGHTKVRGTATAVVMEIAEADVCFRPDPSYVNED